MLPAPDKSMGKGAKVVPSGRLSCTENVGELMDEKLKGFSAPYARLISLVNSVAICAPDKTLLVVEGSLLMLCHKFSRPTVTGVCELSTLMVNRFFKSSMLCLLESKIAGLPGVATMTEGSLICVMGTVESPLFW